MLGTIIHHGGAPMKYSSTNPGHVEMISPPKESRTFNNKHYVLEHAIHGDYALIKAW